MENRPAQNVQNIQDSFLNNARRDKSPITIYLLSGVKLTGRIRSFDRYSVVLETSNNQEQLIFKHAISTVVTSKAVQSHGERMHTSANTASAPAPAATTEPTGHN
jgi:host factor-I protein